MGVGKPAALCRVVHNLSMGVGVRVLMFDNPCDFSRWDHGCFSFLLNLEIREARGGDSRILLPAAVPPRRRCGMGGLSRVREFGGVVAHLSDEVVIHFDDDSAGAGQEKVEEVDRVDGNAAGVEDHDAFLFKKAMD